jgi:hypothetical protein
MKLCNLWSESVGSKPETPLPISGYLECVIPRWPFRSGRFSVEVFTHIDHSIQDWLSDALSFESNDGDFYESGVITNPDQGILFLEHNWRFASAEQQSNLHAVP